jgi:predicted DNA-binding transcriptional regulator YafY
MVRPLRTVLGIRVRIGEPSAQPAPDGWVRVELRGHDVRSLAAEIAGFGAHLVIDDPPELRTALAEVGRELVATYP